MTRRSIKIGRDTSFSVINERGPMRVVVGGRGPKGDKGDAGAAGEDGSSAVYASVYDVTDPIYGAVGDGKVIASGCGITSGTPDLSGPALSFTLADVGKKIAVQGAGAAGADLITTIGAYVGPTAVTLSANAGTTVSNKRVMFGTDNSNAINNAIDAAIATGGIVFLPAGTYVCGRVNFNSAIGVRLVGVGNQSGAGPVNYGSHIWPLVNGSPAVDMAGSTHCAIEWVQIGRSDLLGLPTVGVLVAARSGAESTNIDITNCLVIGTFTYSALYRYGVPDCDFSRSQFYNYRNNGNASAVTLTSTNIRSVTSPNETLNTGAIDTSLVKFEGSHIIDQGDTSSHSLGVALLLDGVSGCSLDKCNLISTNALVAIADQTNGSEAIVIDGCVIGSGYAAADPTYGVRIDSTLTIKGLALLDNLYNDDGSSGTGGPTNSLVHFPSGGRVDGFRVLGNPSDGAAKICDGGGTTGDYGHGWFIEAGGMPIDLPGSITDLLLLNPGTISTVGGATISYYSRGLLPSTYLDTDIALTNNSDTKIPSQKAIKAYVDNIAQGLKWKGSVKAATTANGTLATAFANGQTVDGISLVTGDRVLLKNQSSGSENGIYTVNASGAPTRATDSDASSELIAATVFVEQGTVNADTQWTCTNNTITLGSTALVFAQVSGAGTYTAGSGLSLTGNSFAVNIPGLSAASAVADADLLETSQSGTLLKQTFTAVKTWIKSWIAEADLNLTDITTNNATTARHGLLKKLSNTATEYMDGTGNWSTPAGGGGGSVAPQISWSFNISGKLWGQGAALAPSSWTLTGASGTVAKNTTSGQFRAAVSGAAVTRAGTDVKLTQKVSDIKGWTDLAGWAGKTVVYGRWVYATVANRARISIFDGSSRTYSSYHSGSSTLEFLTVSMTLVPSPNPLEVTLENWVDTGNTTAVFSGGAFGPGSSMPAVITSPEEWVGAKAMLPITTASSGALSGTHALFIGIDPGAMPVAHHGVLHDFYMIANAAPGVGKTFDFTNRKNNATGAITCQIAGAVAVAASDLVNQAVYQAGDGLDFLAVASSGANPVSHGGGIIFEEIPLYP